MDALSSFSRSSSYMDVDVSMFIEPAQEFEPSQGGVVRWVASQTTNPALQALIREAERDRRTRPPTPVDEPTSWTYSLASTTPSASFSTPLSSAWNSSGQSPSDVVYPPPLSGSSSSASSSSSAQRASEPSASRRIIPPSLQRRPLASSTSSANQPPRHSTRPRSSSHSMTSNPSTSKSRYTPRDDEPEAANFIDLLKQMSRQVDENSEIKQQSIRAKGKGKKRDESLESSGIDDHTHHSSARALTKTTSASAVCPVNYSTRAPENTLTSMPARKPESRGRPLCKGPSFGASGVDHTSGKSTPTSLLSKCDSNPAPRVSAGATRQTTFPEPTPNDSGSAMQGIIDLTDTDTEWENPTPSCADTAMCMDSDEESDAKMDVSFYKPEPPPRVRVPPPKSKPQPLPPPTQLTRPPAPTQRTRTGPPPLGMRRATQVQSSQYTSSQGAKGATVPRFKPPLLTHAGASKNGSGTKPVAANSSRAPPEVPRRTSRDPNSSFDVSFDMDADALEEAMKAYD